MQYSASSLVKLTFITMLRVSARVCVGTGTSVVPTGYPTKNLHEFGFCRIGPSCCSHPVILYLNTRVIYRVEKNCKGSCFAFFTLSFPFVPLRNKYIILNTVVVNTLSLWHFLKKRVHCCYPFRIVGKIGNTILFCALIYLTVSRSCNDKSFWTE
jgi:hypothetical protein